MLPETLTVARLTNPGPGGGSEVLHPSSFVLSWASDDGSPVVPFTLFWVLGSLVK